MAEAVTNTDTNVQDFYNGQCDKMEFVCNVNDRELSADVKNLIANLHPDIMKRYYGSGFVIPPKIEGFRILDIGCGSGSLVFVLSKLVGPTGSIVGLDYTEKLVDKCKEYQDFHRKAYGYDKSNIEFIHGNAEDLAAFGFKDATFDIVVSNGVICLANKKDKIFEEAYRVLKPGGEFFLSDVYANKKAPVNMQSDSKCWVLGLTGSQTVSEYMSSASKAGFTTPTLTGIGPIEVTEKIQVNFPDNRYLCARNRLFKLPSDAKCSASSVTYRGNIAGHEDCLEWDVNLTFKKGEAVSVDSELACILSNSRFKTAFDIKATADKPSTCRGQNPFDYLDKLTASGDAPPFAYTVE